MESVTNNAGSIDLQTWARENEIWRKESWKPFLEELEKLYVVLTEFQEFHEWLKETFNTKRISLLSEELKDPARLIVAGGGKDENAFARMMFKLFDVRVAGAKSYEESIVLYEKRGDGIRISVGSKVLGIKEYDFKNTLLQKLKEIVDDLKQQLDVQEEELEVPEEDFSEWVNPKNPKLAEKLNEFLNLSANVLEPVNPYVLFMRYFNVTTLGLLMDYLGCSTEDVKSLAELLGAYVYDGDLNLKSVGEINDENVSELFWILSPYDSVVSSKVGKILELLGESGMIHRIIKEIYPEIDEKFKELWEQRFNSLVELIKSGKWDPPEELSPFLGKNSWINDVCKYKSQAILLVKSDHPHFTGSIGIDVWEGERYPPEPSWLAEYWSYDEKEKELSKYIHHYSPPLKTVYPIPILLEELFPLFATNYLQARTGEDSWYLREYRIGTFTFKFLAIRPTRCESAYGDGKDSYLVLITALGELENESKAGN